MAARALPLCTRALPSRFHPSLPTSLISRNSPNSVPFGARVTLRNMSKPTSTKDTEDWMHRAPYRIHEENENFDVKYEGQCHCGQVKFQLSRDKPLASKLCHCTTCQRQHAAPFQWAAIFHKTDINFSSGHKGLEWYDPTSKSIEHGLPCKVRCSYCHSPIMDEGRNMILMFPSLINLKTQKAVDDFKPTMHLFYSQRVTSIPDGLPKWSGINDDSDLMEDTDAEFMRDYEKKRKRQKDGENSENGSK